jgi:hypothetical protein
MLEAKYRVYDSAVLDAPIEEVWPIIRDMMQLLPLVFGKGVEDCRWIEGGSAEKIPSRFQFTLQPTGDTPLEEVCGRSETDHSVTYRMLGKAIGITGYIATYQLRPITSEPGKCFLDWTREFAVLPDQDAAKISAFLAGLTAQEVATVKAHFSKRSSS